MVVIPDEVYNALLMCTHAAENADNSMSQSMAQEARKARDWLYENVDFE